ncbi:LexA family protein [Lacticaseibacillus zeae]|uniref:XRE family transcriptional regulator n=1 Tax=Lacticaseibacillus zeae subsp. silagei TaxID=3068307 RepID=A0ABD7ZCL3_LACZE|nr:XRE family transcriptional regulator [Lacticaseibacillus sp. NCIMB 15475]WLV84630.1 XRE family transcriptional regulator [Lacticaseibacillus sp. NCIMB 15475]
MTTGKRIADLRKKRSWTQPMLADKMSVSQSTITMWENDKRAVSSEDVKKLAKLFGTTTDYILGIDDSLPINAIPVSDEVADQPVMVYGEIQAGVAKWAEQDIIGQINVTKSFAKRYGAKNLFALQVNGESMNREIPNGYIAVFSKDLEPESGDIVAVMIDSESATIKRYRETSLAVLFEPSSWDPSFKPYVFPKDGIQDFKIIGKFLYATSECI